MILQRKYSRIFRIVRNLTPEDFCSLMKALKDGYFAYKLLDPIERNQDDIDEIYEDLNDQVSG